MKRSENTKQAVTTMLQYYMVALLEEGVTDPKQVIATELPKMIQLTEAQSQYVKLGVAKDTQSIVEQLKLIIQLLATMKSANRMDAEGIDISIQLLVNMVAQIEDIYSDCAPLKEKEEEKDGNQQRETETDKCASNED